jgi:RimJ/RimL family protein N-acetyltransferase
MTRIVLPGEPFVDGPTALRPWRDGDIPWVVEACQDPEIPRWTAVPSPYRESDARAFFSRRYDSLHTGREAPFAIVRSDAIDRGLLGSISLLRFAWEDRRCEVGYWLAREARGQGHATRAVGLICAWGFRDLGLERIELHAAAGNPRSQRVAERVGFTREAVLRSHLRSKHGPLDMVIFGLLPEELRLARAL